MDKTLCFKIDETEIYLDHVLVDYMDVPIFFLCKSEMQYYIALCVDMDEFNYIVTTLSLTDVYELLHAEITMRDVILKQKRYWDIKSGETIENDTVEEYAIDMLDVNFLPKIGAYFEAFTVSTKTYIKDFDKIYFEAEYFSKDVNLINRYDTLMEGAVRFIKEFMTAYNECMSPVDSMKLETTIDSSISELTESATNEMAAAA